MDTALLPEDVEMLAHLGRTYFPSAGRAAPSVPSGESSLEDEVRALLARQYHAKAHAWTSRQDEMTSQQAEAAAAASKGGEGAALPSAPALEDVQFYEGHRIPRENDAAWLIQSLAIKDALLRQLEASLLLPAPERSIAVGLSRRAAGLLANAQRREAVLAAKYKALTKEVDAFRAREVKAAQINAALRRRLRDALTDLDAIGLRREVRTLRADLRAALGREAELQRELAKAQARIVADGEAMERREAAERKLRDDMNYVRSVAVDAQRARAAYAMGDLGDKFLPPSCS